jgi:hypothetical protein
LLAVLIGLAVAPAAGATSRATVVYLYQGSTSGEQDDWGFASVTQPYAMFGHLDWMWRWTVRCVRTATLYQGADVGCQGLVSIHGRVRHTCLYGIGQDCTAAVTNGRGVKWDIGGTYLGGQRMSVSAGEPLAVRSFVPTPSTRTVARRTPSTGSAT